VRPVLALAVGLSALAIVSPAQAQTADDERVNQIIVYGDDLCPASGEHEITVCARKPESERFRIPQALRTSPSVENDAWNNRVLAYETVGPGGWTGCAGKLIGQAYAEKETDPNIRFGELIAAERAKRLSTIDAEAAATQARVEQAEKEYAERERRMRDGEDTPPASPATNGQ
jgi:hypothetical protein